MAENANNRAHRAHAEKTIKETGIVHCICGQACMTPDAYVEHVGVCPNTEKPVKAD